MKEKMIFPVRPHKHKFKSFGGEKMTEAFNVTISGKLRKFINEQIGPEGLYENADEYVRDLIRRDYRLNESRRWRRLIHLLLPGMAAEESEFIGFDPDEIIEAAKQDKYNDAP